MCFFFFWRCGGLLCLNIWLFLCLFFSLLLFFYSVYVFHVLYSVKYVAICVVFWGFFLFLFLFLRGGGRLLCLNIWLFRFFVFFSLLLFFYSVYVFHVSYSVKYVAICVCDFSTRIPNATLN